MGVAGPAGGAFARGACLAAIHPPPCHFWVHNILGTEGRFLVGPVPGPAPRPQSRPQGLSEGSAGRPGPGGTSRSGGPSAWSSAPQDGGAEATSARSTLQCEAGSCSCSLLTVRTSSRSWQPRSSSSPAYLWTRTRGGEPASGGRGSRGRRPQLGCSPAGPHHWGPIRKLRDTRVKSACAPFIRRAAPQHLPGQPYWTQHAPVCQAAQALGRRQCGLLACSLKASQLSATGGFTGTSSTRGSPTAVVAMLCGGLITAVTCVSSLPPPHCPHCAGPQTVIHAPGLCAEGTLTVGVHDVSPAVTRCPVVNSRS